MELGLGLSTYVEMCGLAPSRVLASLRYGAGGWEAATVRMLPTGTVQVVTGATPHGQGHETTWSMLVADKLGVSPDDVEVLHSDTAISPTGMDTYGSRSLAVGGTAIVMAADKVIDKARALAAHQLEVSEDDLEFADGTFRVAGSPDKEMAIQALAFAAFTAHDLPDGMEPSLNGSVTWDPPNFVFPFGSHIAVVEIDTETGQVDLVDYVAVDDCGNQINPLIVEGQVHGGIVQGIAQALFEEAVYDDDGTLQEPDADGLHGAHRRRVPELHARPHHHAQPHQPDGGQGHRGGGHHRQHPRRHERRGRRPVALRHHRHRHAGHARAGVAGDPSERCIEQGSLGMIPAAFDYVRADSADAAIAALVEHGDDAKLLAGGHSLLPLMKLRLAAPSVLVDIGRLSDLSYVRDGGDHVAIGGLTRHRDLEISDLLGTEAPLLRHAAGQVGDPQVRHRGTIGGSIAHGDPASDLPAVLLAMRATIVAKGPDGERTIPVDDFFTGFLETALSPTELLTEIRVPKAAGAGLVVPEAAPARPGLGHRRRGGGAERHHRHRSGEHGLGAAAGGGRGDGRHRRCVGGRRGGGGRRGHRAERRPQRQRRVPPPPGAGARAPGTGGVRSVTATG